MVLVLLAATCVLAALVAVLASRVHGLEQRLASRDPGARSAASTPSSGSLDEPRPDPEFVITHLGEPEVEPAPVVAAPVFADLVVRETVVHAASLVQGLRRALAPETRNRIRFQMRQEVKRSRKQRRTEMREVRREWAARQRTAMSRPTIEEPAA